MKRLLLAVAAIVLGPIAGSVTASAQDDGGPPNFAPVEMYACNYRDGRDSDDFDDAMDYVRDGAEVEGSIPYAAWRLNKWLGGVQQFDFLYIGAWDDGASMGQDMAAYFSEGQKADAAWEDAVDCGAAFMFASMNVKPPGDGAGQGDFVLTIADCSIAEGRKTDDAISGLRSWGAHRTDTGSPGGMWIWFPAFGNGAPEFDFKMVTGHRGAAAFGNYWQWYVDNQAYTTWGDMFDGLLECDIDRVYNGDTVVNTLSGM